MTTENDEILDKIKGLWEEVLPWKAISYLIDKNGGKFSEVVATTFKDEKINQEDIKKESSLLPQTNPDTSWRTALFWGNQDHGCCSCKL